MSLFRPNHQLVFLTTLLLSSTLAAQEAQYFEQPPAKPHFVFQWDALARYDSIYHLRVRPDIERGRFEVRPELDFVVSDRFSLGVRAVGDLGTDHNEDNALNFDNYRSRGATIERYFIEAKPGPVLLRAGAFGMPLLATEMLWDHDIQTPGVAAAWEIRAGGSTLTISGAGLYGPQREGDGTRIGAGQILWRIGDPDRFEATVAGSYWNFEPKDLKPSYFRQNYIELADGRREFVSRYHIADLIIRFRFPVAGIPVAVSLDGLKNYGVRDEARSDGDAFEGTVAVGRVGNPWDWRVFYTYQYVERDALLGAYNTDDWWFHTWYRGSRAGVAVTLLPRVFLQGAVMFQKRLDLQKTLNRITVDLVKMF
jgi:Putative porin